MTIRAAIGYLLLATGFVWTVTCLISLAAVLWEGRTVDVPAAVGIFSVGLLAATWGWLLAGRR
jgi:hypothetical protein